MRADFNRLVVTNSLTLPAGASVVSDSATHAFTAANTHIGAETHTGAETFVSLASLVSTAAAAVAVSNGDGTTALTPHIQHLGTTKANSGVLIGVSNTTDDTTVAPSLSFLKNGNAAPTSNTVVASGEILGEITAYGADGTDFKSAAARISFEVDGTPGTGDMPGRIVLSTTADNAETLVECVRIDNAHDTRIANNCGLIVGSATAQVTISDGDGTTAAVPELQVLGTAKVDASMVLGSFSATATSAACPSLNFLKSANATIGSNTVVVSGEVLGEVNFFGADGTDFKSCAARIAGIVDTTPGTGDMPGRLVFSTSTDAGETLTSRMEIRNAGQILVGTSTSNANVTVGVTIQQGANDDGILEFKSSDVTHGVTTIAETDVYGSFRKHVAGDGGLRITGLADTSGIGVAVAAVATTVSGTRSTSGTAAVHINGSLASGTGVASLGADKNILGVGDNGTMRFFLDSDGDSFQDVGTAWTNFDDFDDPKLLTALSAGVSRPGDPVREEFASVLEEYRPQLERARLVQFNDDGHHFVNMSRLTMVLTGAVRQVSDRLAKATALVESILPRLVAAESKLAQIA